jgi:hypothetical protein
MTYQLKLRQLPELTFDRAAVLGVAAVALLVEPLRWKPTILDPLILLFVAGTVTSEFLNNGWTPAQSLLFYMVCTVVLPYVLAKHFLSDQPRALSFGRVLVLVLAGIAVISVVEFRLGINTVGDCCFRAKRTRSSLFNTAGDMGASLVRLSTPYFAGWPWERGWWCRRGCETRVRGRRPCFATAPGSWPGHLPRDS